MMRYANDNRRKCTPADERFRLMWVALLLMVGFVIVRAFAG
jgi:hypothetical protein